jgi:predicted transcriptional regulator
MEQLWSSHEADVVAVHRALHEPTGNAVSTVQSSLRQLMVKGLVERRKVSHAHLYRARISRQEFLDRRFRALIGPLHAADRDALANAFLDLVASVKPEALLQLQRIVSARRGEIR